MSKLLGYFSHPISNLERFGEKKNVNTNGHNGRISNTLKADIRKGYLICNPSNGLRRCLDCNWRQLTKGEIYERKMYRGVTYLQRHQVIRETHNLYFTLSEEVRQSLFQKRSKDIRK